MKRGLSLLTLCSSVFVGGLPAFGQENLVLGRAYDYWPKPNYNESTDKGDITQLTDGASFPSESMWTRQSTVGWAVGLEVPVVIRFDLGQEATVKEVRFATASGIDAGVVVVGLRVFASLDDRTYVLAGELPAPAPKSQTGRYAVRLSVPLDTRARHVAIVAVAPKPHPFVFVDEIEIIGKRPADPKSQLPVQGGVRASGAEGLQQLLAGGRRSANLLADLSGPFDQHLACWPEASADAQRAELKTLHRRAISDPESYDTLRAELTANHRKRARTVYSTDALVREVVPDERFTMLSLPRRIDPPPSATIHTVVNALEATALGVANLADDELPLKIEMVGRKEGAPRMTARVGWFFVTGNARYIPDALLADDAPQTIPSGESRLVWFEAESTGATPGIYDYDVIVRVGEKAHPIALKVHVHDVALDRETPLVTGNWAYLNTGETPILEQMRASMLSHRSTFGDGSGGGSYTFPDKDAQGNVIRPVRQDFTNMDKFLAFHEDFAQINLFIPFDHHSDRPHSDWFGPAEWMSDQFEEIFGEWLGQIVARIKASGRDYDTFSIHAFDETFDKKVEQMCRLIHSVDPKVRVIATIPQASREATRGLVEAGMKVFVYHAPRLEYDNAPEGLDVLSSGGRELWFYSAADVKYGTGKERDPLGWYRTANAHSRRTGIAR